MDNQDHDKPVRVVVCSAIAYKALLILGPRHFDHVMHTQIRGNPDAMLVKPSAWEQGFIDQWGVFMDRVEALAVAKAAGQINRYRPQNNETWLSSEDLW